MMDFDQNGAEAGAIAEHPARAFFRGLLEVLQALAIAVLISVALNLFVVQVTEVRQKSMEPTLLSGDRVLVSKIDYRLHVPERGDIVVFRPPLDASIPFVKRVIGLPGDTVDLRDGKVFVNGQPLEEPYAVGATHTRAPAIPCVPGEAPRCSYPFVVPPNSIFVMGDNRPVSGDSREWGAVQDDHVIGKVTIRFWPIVHLHLFAF